MSPCFHVGSAFLGAVCLASSSVDCLLPSLIVLALACLVVLLAPKAFLDLALVRRVARRAVNLVGLIEGGLGPERSVVVGRIVALH